MDYKFHCHEDHFTSNVSAFTYTEYSIDPHIHDFYEINIILNGFGIHQIENTTFSVKRGDVFVIPPTTVHAYFNTEHLEVYHFLLKSNFVKRSEKESLSFPGYLQFMEIEPFLRKNYSDAMFLHLTPSQLMELMQDFKFIESNSLFDKKDFYPFHDHVAWKIIYHLSYLLHEQTQKQQKNVTTKYKQQILDTLEFLHSHFNEKITVENLASRVFLSRSTFLRNFFAVCNCSPLQYLTNYRIKKAIDLSNNSTMSKTEIAHYCGFYDLSHMERNIKKLSADS